MAHSTRNNAKKAAKGAGTKYSTRNQQRKRDYAAMALKDQGRKSNTASPATKMSLGKKRTNHKRGTKVAEKETRKKEADARNTEYRSLPPLERLKNLDKLFGPGLGAKRERTRIQNRIDNPPATKAAKKVEVEVQVSKEKVDTKQHKKESHDRKKREVRDGR